jgi:hypothetical protein
MLRKRQHGLAWVLKVSTPRAAAAAASWAGHMGLLVAAAQADLKSLPRLAGAHQVAEE